MLTLARKVRLALRGPACKVACRPVRVSALSLLTARARRPRRRRRLFRL